MRPREHYSGFRLVPGNENGLGNLSRLQVRGLASFAGCCTTTRLLLPDLFTASETGVVFLNLKQSCCDCSFGANPRDFEIACFECHVSGRACSAGVCALVRRLTFLPAVPGTHPAGRLHDFVQIPEWQVLNRPLRQNFQIVGGSPCHSAHCSLKCTLLRACSALQLNDRRFRGEKVVMHCQFDLDVLVRNCRSAKR